jgi:hypothetical protein
MRLAIAGAALALGLALLTPGTAHADQLQCRTDPMGTGTMKTCYTMDGEAVWEMWCNAYGTGCQYHICGPGDVPCWKGDHW